MTSWTKELDEAAELATESGYWHVVLFYLLCGLAALPTSFLVFSQVFTNATPEHWCSPPPSLEGLGLSADLLRNLTVPGEHEGYDSCRTYTFDEEALDKIYETFARHVPNNTQISNITEAILLARREELVHCDRWSYSKEHYQRTLVTEFSLVCDSSWLPSTSNTLFWVGSIFGNLFFGWMSDRYGRRPTILLMIMLEVPLTVASSFPPNYWVYIAVRVACGLFFPALYQLPFVLALELMPPKRRTYTGIVVGMLFASGMCLLALLAYALRDWFHLSLATSLPFVFLFGYFWLTPESPRWLVGRGRVAEAEKVFRDIARRNGIELSRGFLLEIHKKIKRLEEENEVTILSINNSHIIGMPQEYDRRITNMINFKPEDAKGETLDNIVETEINSNLKEINREIDIKEDDSNEESQLRQSMKQTQLESQPKTNRLRKKSSQLVNKIFKNQDDDVDNRIIDDQNSEGDCKASLIDMFRYPNIRKKFFILTFDWVALGVVYNSLSYNTPNLGVDDYLAFFIGGVVELPSYVLAWRCMDRFGRRWVLCVFMSIGGASCLSCLLVPDALPWVTVTLAMLGRLCAAASFAVFYVMIGELLPTVLRSQAMGSSSFIAGLGLLACPYIVDLAKYARALPLTILGVLSFLGAITSLFLPETLNQPLPQTLGDGEMFGREFKILSCVKKPNEVFE